jgi:hypothetical protein
MDTQYHISLYLADGRLWYETDVSGHLTNRLKIPTPYGQVEIAVQSNTLEINQDFDGKVTVIWYQTS